MSVSYQYHVSDCLHCPTCISHGQDAWAGVLELEVLICEFGPIDGLATSAVAGSEVATCIFRSQVSDKQQHDANDASYNLVVC
jgi:hypothetical protein